MRQMRVTGIGVLVALVATPWFAVAVAGQQRPAEPNESDRIRFQISLMEGVLERAAEDGARQTSRKLQEVTSEPLLWTGTLRARGYRLENYGYFFDLDVPSLSGTVLWSMQAMDQRQAQNDLELLVNGLRAQIQTLTDRQAREQMTQALRRFEVQLTSNKAPAVESKAPARPPAPPIGNPFDLYETDVENSVIDAMLDHTLALPLGPDEWLTVAARDSSPGRVTPGQPYDIVTITLRVRGSDLNAFRAGKLTREEARKRVDVKEF
jgi:hypothetical protein